MKKKEKLEKKKLNRGFKFYNLFIKRTTRLKQRRAQKIELYRQIFQGEQFPLFGMMPQNYDTWKSELHIELPDGSKHMLLHDELIKGFKNEK